MALPIRAAGMPHTFVAPGCGDLPACVQPATDGGPGEEVVTAWQLDPQELAEVVASGGIVYLRVIGGQPPVEICGFNPVRL